MNNYFLSIFQCVKEKKVYFLLLCIVTIAAIIIGVYSAIKFTDGVFAVDLSNIAYIKFLQGECGLFSLIFGLSLSLCIFFGLILLFSFRSFLLPLAVIFYIYLVYSQVVVIVSLILIYGLINCLILLLVLIIYVLFIISLFVLAMLSMLQFTNDNCYFKHCLNTRNVTFWLLIAIVLSCIIFSFVLAILKSFVILLVY